jgi:metal-dependent hydrolase (beta-lactamase superfamily II)
VAWVAEQLRTLGVVGILGAHCTGLDRLAYLREALHLGADAGVFS